MIGLIFQSLLHKAKLEILNWETTMARESETINVENIQTK